MRYHSNLIALEITTLSARPRRVRCWRINTGRSLRDFVRFKVVSPPHLAIVYTTTKSFYRPFPTFVPISLFNSHLQHRGNRPFYARGPARPQQDRRSPVTEPQQSAREAQTVVAVFDFCKMYLVYTCPTWYNDKRNVNNRALNNMEWNVNKNRRTQGRGSSLHLAKCSLAQGQGRQFG